MPRPRFKATAEHRHMIESMAAIGTPVERIATMIGERGIDPKTLRKYFAVELERGAARGESALRQKRYQLAMAGNTAMLKDALQDMKSKRTRWDQQSGTAPLNSEDVRAKLANLLERRRAGRKGQQDGTADSGGPPSG